MEGGFGLRDRFEGGEEVGEVGRRFCTREVFGWCCRRGGRLLIARPCVGVCLLTMMDN